MVFSGTGAFWSIISEIFVFVHCAGSCEWVAAEKGSTQLAANVLLVAPTQCHDSWKLEKKRRQSCVVIEVFSDDLCRRVCELPCCYHFHFLPEKSAKKNPARPAVFTRSARPAGKEGKELRLVLLNDAFVIGHWSLFTIVALWGNLWCSSCIFS